MFVIIFFLLQGEKGESGSPGIPGFPGKPVYMHNMLLIFISILRDACIQLFFFSGSTWKRWPRWYSRSNWTKGLILHYFNKQLLNVIPWNYYNYFFYFKHDLLLVRRRFTDRESCTSWFKSQLISLNQPFDSAELTWLADETVLNFRRSIVNCGDSQNFKVQIQQMMQVVLSRTIIFS